MKLFVFDIDDTLVSHSKGNGKVVSSAKEAIGKIVEKGYKVVIATGRPYSITRHIMEEININDAIVSNGSAMVINGEVVYNKPIKKDAMQSFLCDIKSKGLATLAFDAHDVYVYDDIKEKEFFHKQINKFIKPMYEGTNQEIKKLEMDKDYNIVSVFSSEMINDFEEVSTTWYDTVGYELMNEGSTKAAGIIEYISKCNINKDNVYVFGDNYNDIPMFKEFYKNSYVLGNACDDVKNHARNICDHIDNDGVYKAIIEILEN